MSADPSTIIANYRALVVGNDTIYACTALACYEYLITFHYEMEFLWRRKWSAATWLFLLNRYLMVAVVIIQAAPYTPQVMCILGVIGFVNTLVFIPSILAAAFSALRVYALLQHSAGRLIISSLVFTLGLIQFIAQIYLSNRDMSVVYVDDTVLGSSCDALTANISPAAIASLPLLNTVTPIVADVIVVIVTWIKTVQQVRQTSSLGLNMGLSGVMLRDGSIYFIVLLAINVVLVIMTPDPNSPLDYALTPIFSVLQPILISHFLINLRQVDTPHSDLSSSVNRHPSRFSIPNFRIPTTNSVIGNMGEQLDYRTAAPFDEEDIEIDVSKDDTDIPAGGEYADFEATSERSMTNGGVQEEPRSAIV